MELDGDDLLNLGFGQDEPGIDGDDYDSFELDCDAYIPGGHNHPASVRRVQAPRRAQVPQAPEIEEAFDVFGGGGRLEEAFDDFGGGGGGGGALAAFATPEPEPEPAELELHNAVSKGAYKSKYSGKLDKSTYLGKGKFSQVYRCQRKGSTSVYAVKVIDKKGLTKKQLDEIHLEAAMCQIVSHDNIMKIHDYYAEKKKNYLVFEFISGGELFDHIVSRDDGISEKESAEWMTQLLSGIQFCHQKGIVHRDIKLENLMLTGSNSVTPNSIKLVDFGLAALIPDKPKKLGVVGSANYVAPEVIKEEPYGKAVDIWSCGVVLYILLSGIMPFLGNDQAETFELVKVGKFTFPTADFKGVTPVAKALVSEMLQYDHELRITVTDALRHDWMTGGAAKVKRKGSVMSLRKSKSTRRASVRKSSGGAGRAGSIRITEVTGIIHDLGLGKCKACVTAGPPGSYLVKVQPKTQTFAILLNTGRGMVEMEAKVDHSEEHAVMTEEGLSYGVLFQGMRFKNVNDLIRGFNRLKIQHASAGTLQIKRSADLFLTSQPPKETEPDVLRAGPGAFMLHKTKDGHFLSANDNGQGVVEEELTVMPSGAVHFYHTTFKSLEDMAANLHLNPFKGKSGRPIVAKVPAFHE